MANQDETDITTIATTITTLGALTVGSAGTDGQTRSEEDMALLLKFWTDEKNRRAGSLCAAPTSTNYGLYGGSGVAQIAVGARQF